MKKLIFGVALMLCGVICGTGWLIAHCCACVEAGAWSTVMNIFGFGSRDGWIIILFYVISVVGMIISLKGLKEDKR